jgi:hypothetical protein
MKIKLKLIGGPLDGQIKNVADTRGEYFKALDSEPSGIGPMGSFPGVWYRISIFHDEETDRDFYFIYHSEMTKADAFEFLIKNHLGAPSQ